MSFACLVKERNEIFTDNSNANDHFGMLAPEVQTILPFTKTTWDGTGVEADLAVPAGDALRAAHLKAIRSLMEQTPDQTCKTALQDIMKKLEPSHSAK